MSNPKNIVISHVYSSANKGDAALTSVLIKDLKRVFKKANITILTLDVGAGSFEGVPQKPSFMAYALNKYSNPLLKLAYTLYMIVATLAWAATRGGFYIPKHLGRVAAVYQAADLIVPVGGGYIRSRPGLMHRFNVPLLLHPLLFGYLLGKPTVLYAQSVGPFQNKFEQALVAFVLKRMTLIMLREDTSLALLASLGVTHNVIRAIDSGFLLNSQQKIDIRKKYHIAANNLLVGVTVRAWLAGEAQTRYELAVAKALDDLVDTYNVWVIFIPQVTAGKGDDDRVVSRRVRDFMQHTNATTLINDAPDHHQIKALYDNLDLLLGTRFHSVIFSLTSLVPVLAIEYEHKTSGIMRDLGLQQWVIKIEDVDNHILNKQLQALVSQRAAYRDQLARRIPVYVRQARATAALLKESYERAVS